MVSINNAPHGAKAAGIAKKEPITSTSAAQSGSSGSWGQSETDTYTGSDSLGLTTMAKTSGGEIDGTRAKN